MVIDGQQRLTTLAILLCAIRDELPDDAKPQKKAKERSTVNRSLSTCFLGFLAEWAALASDNSDESRHVAIYL
jgi:hypothetical protein